MSRLHIPLLPLICVLAVFSSPGISHGEAMDVMWWRMTALERASDGGMTVDFELRSPPGGISGGIEIYCLSYPRSGTSSTRAYGQPAIYRKRASGDDGSPSVTLYSGRTEKIEMRAKAVSAGRTYYAKTVVLCYGDSGNFDPDAERVESAPEWPGFDFQGEGNFYRAQTGTPVLVMCDFNPPSISVYENEAKVATVTADQDGIYSYVPPHDKELSKSGHSAKKDLVFASPLPGGSGAVSFYLPVHRAYYGNVDVLGGVAVISASAMLSAGLVLVRGRRFKWR